MSRSAVPPGVIATLFALIFVAAILLAVPAQAQNNKSWVAQPPAGDDANPCTRAQPCATLQRAHDHTNAGGEIGFVDSGQYGHGLAVTINKSISIIAEGVDATIMQPASGPGLAAIFVIATGNDVIRLQGLTIDGVGTGSGGIFWGSGAELEIKNCVVRNFNSTTFGSGIQVLTSGASRLVVTDTVVANNGTGTTGAGILIKPQSGGSAAVVLDGVTAANNVFGIVADGSGSTAGINMTIVNSNVHGSSQNGIVATTPGGGAPIGVMVKDTRSVNNNIGIRSTGVGVTVRVSNSTIGGNGTGLAFSGSGALLSFGNNKVEGNVVNGAFSGPVALK